jgi:4-amino-4-deoxy-L-arabinose transferase-like glycosyltransferase
VPKLNTIIQKKLKIHYYPLAIISILLIAACLRFYKLAQVPHGMTWDEAAIGYNGYAVLHTRRDEWLKKLPISFMSFGDYKAPLAIYLNGIFTFLFGMNLWAVRLPFTLSSIFAVLGIIFLVEEIFKLSNKTRSVFTNDQRKKLALLAGIMMTISPWHLHYSRAGFESGMSLMFLIWGLLFLFKFSQGSFFTRLALPKNLKEVLTLLKAITLLACSIYTYHSAKIVAPILAISLVLFKFKIFLQKKWQSLIAFLWTLVLMMPLLIDSLMGKGLTRGGTLIFSQNLSFFELISTMIKNYISHLHPNFLIFAQTTTLRHGTGAWGVLLPITYLSIIYLILRLAFQIYKKLSKKIDFSLPFSKVIIHFALIWILVALLPACLGKEIPHSNRALLALPGFILFAILGLIDFYILVEKKIKKVKLKNKQKKTVLKGFFISLGTIQFLSFLAFQKHYYTEFARASAADFQDGYLEAFTYVKDYAKGENGRKKVDKVIFTSDYGQPYIYALFVNQLNPIWYRGGSLNHYEFKDHVHRGDLGLKNTIIVGSKDDDLPDEQVEKFILGSDGEVRFKIYVND